LKKGHHGDDVKMLQSKLAAKGYLRSNEIDGDFGKITLGAVLAFQFENDLEVDGAAGRETQKALGMEVL
jgi:N-acetylmuramoyl-L-alanine amidase